MRKIEVEELRRIQISILDYVADFCDKNGINYWLDAGTLLGAVRHKGYIPWDDDIDIGMLREDYEKFAQLFNAKNQDSQYQYHNCRIDKNWHFPFGKVVDTTTRFLQDGHEIGINIDIFCFDKAPADEALFQKMYQKRDKLKVLNSIQMSSHPARGGLLRKVAVYLIRALLNVWPKYYFIRRIEARARRYENSECTTIGSFTGEYNIKPCQIEVVAKLTEGEFEGKTYKIPAGYDQWLTAFYGSDYMQLPPVEKRKRHTFEAYVQK